MKGHISPESWKFRTVHGGRKTSVHYSICSIKKIGIIENDWSLQPPCLVLKFQLKRVSHLSPHLVNLARGREGFVGLSILLLFDDG